MPLGEEVERYRLRVINGEDEVARELETGETTFVYSHSAQTQDGFNERFQISVAQVSHAVRRRALRHHSVVWVNCLGAPRQRSFGER